MMGLERVGGRHDSTDFAGTVAGDLGAGAAGQCGGGAMASRWIKSVGRRLIAIPTVSDRIIST